MDMIYERACAEELPPEAMQYDGDGLRRLVALCRALQAEAGDDPFYLGCRTAGELLGVDHTTASRWLSGLVMDGLLVVSELGTMRGRRRASRYYYVGHLAHADTPAEILA